MARRKPKTWFVVADGARARIFVQEGLNGALEALEARASDAARKPDRELVSDRPGRAFESVGPLRHGVAPPTDPKRHEKEKFIADLAARIDAAAAAKEFNRLVVAAPAKALGDLRKALGAEASGLIVAEHAKDLTNTPEPALAEHLGLTA